MKQRQKTELWILVAIVVASFCFMPMINMQYEVIVQKQVSEEYTTVEPYIIQEKVQEPYQTWVTETTWPPANPAITPAGQYYPTTTQRLETRLRTVTVNITKYREVTKTRLVTRPIVETQTKRVSILRYLLR